jgi:thioredoxin 1
MNEKIREVNDANFSDAVKSVTDRPVFVDFWAPWCGPCRMVAPLLDQAADEFDGKALIAKYNVDESSAIASENGIRGIPTILVYKNGEVVGQRVGAMSKSELDSFIKQFC